MSASFDTYAGCTAVVTGASMGLGAEIARQLARRGAATLVLSARSTDRLEALAAELRAGSPGGALQVHVVPLDLTEAGAPERLHAATSELGLQVDLLVNNAGFGKWGQFEARPLAVARSMIALNIEALVALKHLYRSAMLERGRGAVLNVSSLAAFFSLPYVTLYSATKAFVTSFSEGLWGEWGPRGVIVSALCPGGTESEFHSTSETYLPDRDFMPADIVVSRGLDALLAGKPTVFASVKHLFATRVLPLMTRRRAVLVMESRLRPPAGWTPA